jgi:iron(III) transport system substrate-binding protein
MNSPAEPPATPGPARDRRGLPHAVRGARRRRSPGASVALMGLAVVLGGGLVAGCGEAGEPVVNVYSHRHYDTDEALFRKFTEETGIEVRVVSASADELMARLEREGAASPADLLITVDAGRLHRARERELLRAVSSRQLEAAVPEAYRDPDGYWYGLTRRVRIIAYALDRVDPSDVQTYESLTDERWAGRIVARSSENIYNVSHLASIIAAHGPEVAEAWVRGVVANFARPPQGNDTDQIRDVAAGVGDLALVNTYYVGRLLNAEDEASRELASRVGVIFPNQGGRGAHVNVSAAGVTRHAPNPANAVRLLEFLVGEEAQRAFAEGNYEYPVREGVAWAPALQAWGEFRSDPLPLSRLGEFNNEAVRIFDRGGWR